MLCERKSKLSNCNPKPIRSEEPPFMLSHPINTFPQKNRQHSVNTLASIGLNEKALKFFAAALLRTIHSTKKTVNIYSSDALSNIGLNENLKRSDSLLQHTSFSNLGAVAVCQCAACRGKRWSSHVSELHAACRGKHLLRAGRCLQRQTDSS